MQKFYNGFHKLKEIVKSNNFTKILIVSDEHILQIPFVEEILKSMDTNYKIYTKFTPNPKMAEAEEGLKYFKDGNFDTILAIGGGSALDVAKYIKLQANTSLIAVPTTAGSGSESTRFAVIYDNGKKQSINSIDIIPEFVIFESEFLKTLPEYQKKCTILDALCHSIESFWSVNSNIESKKIATKSINLILQNYKQYINNNESVYDSIMYAANLSGQAINITQTTAGHAMSYKLTSEFNIPHGHAVAICLSKVWEYLNNNIHSCCDPRGEQYLLETLTNLSNIISLDDFNSIIEYFDLKSPNFISREQLDSIANSVNVERLANFPIKLTTDNISEIYLKINNNKNLK